MFQTLAAISYILDLMFQSLAAMCQTAAARFLSLSTMFQRRAGAESGGLDRLRHLVQTTCQVSSPATRQLTSSLSVQYRGGNCGAVLLVINLTNMSWLMVSCSNFMELFVDGKRHKFLMVVTRNCDGGYQPFLGSQSNCQTKYMNAPARQSNCQTKYMNAPARQSNFFYNVYSHKEKKIQCRYESPTEETREEHG